MSTQLSMVRLTRALALAALLSSSPRAAVAPKELLIYYSWPSIINGSTSVAEAAAHFGQYDVIVLGDLLEKASHPDHANTVAILAHPALAQTETYGYITLGVTSQNLSPTEIALRIDEWKATGADGILFDEYGYDYQVTRERQNAAVAHAHAVGMKVIANAWIPADAFDPSVHPSGNPTGLPALLGPDDAFLFESFQIQEGAYVSESAWRVKADALLDYRAQSGSAIFAVTTALPETTYEEAAFHYAWFSAALDGWAALGWGEHLFAALTAQAPYRARPAIDPGPDFVGDLLRESPIYRRFTDTGQLRVDAASHAYAFLPGTTDAETGSADQRFALFPNPSREGVRFRNQDGRAYRLLLHDAGGRLCSSPIEVGAGETVSIDAPSAGTYFVRVLETGASIRVVRLR